MARHKRSKSESNLGNFVETGNRIIRADHSEDENDVIVLYRGIKPHSGPYAEQTDPKNAVIGSKKPLDTTKGVEVHVDGGTDSSYISWTPFYKVAAAFAEEKGTVMKGVFRRDDLVHPIANFLGETEYSIIGTVVGAKPVKEQNNLSQEQETQLRKNWYQEAEEIRKVQVTIKQAQKADPLRKREREQESEFTPDVKPVRTWKRLNFFESELVSGPGVAKKPTLERTPSSPNIKYKSKEMPTQVVPNVKEGRLNSSRIADNVAEFTQIVEALYKAFPSKWTSFLTGELSQEGAPHKKLKKFKGFAHVEKTGAISDLRNEIVRIQDQLIAGKMDIEDGMASLKLAIEEVIRTSNKYQEGTTLGKKHSLFGKSFQITSSKVASKLDEFMETHFGTSSKDIDLP
ncbi:hypothetical protein [Legionella hackeliae]|uniref:Uncharacterized protein n=1 Tax=Legionella hackeliae TaxID=449 RepID=A0A0A8UL16_LEGHA|nr:hypothetical protein [Legionella hackeliae]KTD14829.1 hypothetical protein Lhac_0359 [Legionella hackeliae]CEK09545.1 protein of unknown function [Legionella hackeliae]STX49455.1 Uncharacterised protein [Legionella hackeliae]